MKLIHESAFVPSIHINGIISVTLISEIPGHALHEKGLQRQKGVVPLFGSQEQSALLVPLINR